MSFIVKGLHKPKECQWWQNGRVKRCWFLNDDDACALQKDAKKLTWEEQFAKCPIVAIKWQHGELVDKMRNEVVLEAEDDILHGWKRL